MLVNKYTEDGYSFSSFDYLLLESFALKNPLRISEIMEYVSRYIEEYFFDEFKRIGIFLPEEEPFKETRGGDRIKQNQE